MDGIRQQIEASLSRTRDVIMEDRYRRLHYDPTFGPYWTSPEGAVVNGRLKRHLPVFSKKKSKDKTDLFEVPAYLKPYKDKYGSVSAHSTSAIYGALRAPHCHALYSPSDVWYASVRSLNSRPRDIVYPVDAYDWREPIYEDITRETRTELHHHPSCGCTKSRRMPSGSSKASRPSPRCKYCASSSSSANGSLNSVPSTKRASVLPEKLKLLSVSEENDEVRTESSTDRMSGYKKRVDPSRSKSSRYVTESATKDSSAVCRKSILECDVTAYDLIKKIAKSPSVSEVDSDDDLSDNAVLKYPRGKGKKNSKLSPSASASKKSSDQSGKKQKFPKSQSENSIYSEAPSVLLGGQRIFTNHQHSPKQSDLVSSNHVNGSSNGNARSSSTRWRQLSASDESICIPEPDYDYSDDSDFENSKFKDLKITYSPPLVRKSSLDDRKNLGKDSREISKSMSSLRSEDMEHPVSMDNDSNTSRTLPSAKSVEYVETVTQDQVNEEQTVTSESVDPKSFPATSPDLSTAQSDRALDVYVRNLRVTKYESFSSSDCSSNGGTLSSDYQTWTSSSSGELKSILKKKRRENAIQEMEDAARVFSDTESKEAQRKKQVQFRSRGDTILVEHIQASERQFIEESVEYAEISELPLSEGGCESESGKSICNGVSSGYDARGAPDQAVIEDEVIYETLNEPMKIVKISSSSSHFQSLGSTHPLQKREQNPEETEESAVTSRDHTQLEHVQKEIDLEFKAITSIREHSFDGTGLSSPPSETRSKTLSMDLASSLPHQLPARSSSLEDISEAARKSEVARDKSISGRSRRRRTTLPKRRFSDLHLHILLCPTASSRCGDASSSSDDVPLTVPRTHRSLPESPSELEDEPTFCFDFLDKSSKEKALSLSRSTFYVPVESTEKQQNEESKNSGREPSPRLQRDNTLEKSTNGSGQTEHHSVAPSVSDDYNHYTSDDDQLDLPIRDSDLDEASPLHDDTDDDNLENDYEILDPIYEELTDVSTSPSKRLSSLESPQKSFFEGASKTDILSYLEDAKERGLEDLTEDDIKVITEEDEEEEEEDRKIITEEEDAGEKKRVIANNNQNQEKPVPESDDAVNSLELIPETSNAETTKANRSPSAEVERNDSGVGTETSKPARISRLLPTDSEEQLCADCDHQVEPMEDEVSGLLFNPLVCKKCELRRCERKEIIIEFVDTELKYGRDLKIIKEEFYRPMEIAGLLGKEQLLSVFLNLDELTSVNMKFSEKLQDALDIATEQGDEDYTTVNIGKLFLETSSMLHAFETYCVKQASASVLLNNLEKEKELLRIFLRVSQMENTLLRRMNLPAFLMVPVQRVTRYPLLLCRLHKVTPFHHKDREALREAQQKVELHLEHINQQTKGVGGTKIWRRISNISASHRRLGNLQDIGSIKLRKMALEVLKWNQDEVRFVMAGKLLFTQVTDYPWNKKGKTLKFTHLHALLVALGKPNSNYRPDLAAENGVLFPRNTGIRDASLLLMKEKNGRFVVVREPLHLGSCVISSDSDADDVFEIQEYTTKEAYLLKGENKKDTREWLRQLRYHAKDLGSWRRRRNALANIMINGMIRQ